MRRKLRSVMPSWDTKRKSDPVLQIEHVSYAYQNRIALRDISFSVAEGELLTILGANGSGKSTLLRVLDALYFPTEGMYKAFGKRITAGYLHDERQEMDFRRRVGYVFQDPEVQLFSPTVYDEIAFGPSHMGLRGKALDTRVHDAMRLLEIGHLRDRTPYLLSGGEMKKVALASVLSIRPEVWLFDEPTASLDPRSQSNLLEFIQKIHKKGNTVITTTHDLSILEEIAERVIVISEDHTVAADTTPREILSDLRFLKSHNLIHSHEHVHRHTRHIHPHIHRTAHSHRA